MQHVADERRDVFLAFAHARQLDGDDIEPVMQVQPEAAFPHLPHEIVVGGGYHPERIWHATCTAERTDLLLLQEAQQLCLGFER
jgi:hypothetical protein